MRESSAAQDEQAQLWNGPAARAWIDAQALIDTMFRPIEQVLLDSLMPGGGGRLLDIGCGTGGTTLAAARRLGTGAVCTGVDVSEPMVAAARERAAWEGINADFIAADAATARFEPQRFDAMISRFGVMFFADPVAAFAHLRRAARSGAMLRFVAWRGVAENGFMTTAERAAAQLMPALPPRDPDAPGQFAFADGARVRAILDQAGWRDVRVVGADIDCAMPAAALPDYLMHFGPLGRALRDVDADTRRRVVDAVLPAFEPYRSGTGIRYAAACWIVDARAP
ncbi:MAG: class I SAM-dependent methyltransferase [Pseudomonadota bacterium]